ncbi:tetratricopeptide repeat protein, partial [Laspinema palackyanum]|uniref:tetratricopeptide repeat protein n=1 Tax=Laspinema palackyanum TaxID=3231601 RepID=UPI00345CFB67|nr:tetratricopeptide repeat protein [Laspinema sp. D2c]
MDEQRVQAYLSVVQQLLTCPSGEEPQILNQSLELVDKGLVQVCELVAAQLQEQGEENQAAFLRNLAQQLGEFLGLEAAQPSQSETIPAEYEAFLQEALRLTRESDVNPSVVYPFLASQQAKLNEDLIALIPAFATINNIVTLLNFANLVQQFPLGQRAVNLEIAIAIYTKALDFFDSQNHATTWATIQNNLASAYRNRIRGKRGENLERAIACCEAALKVYTCSAYPEEWATTQNNLANAYGDRIRGERGENLERAIGCYEAALKVRTRSAYPEDWAMTQNNLGLAYQTRIRGERGENLERAIGCYEAALKVRTRSA